MCVCIYICVGLHVGVGVYEVALDMRNVGRFDLPPWYLSQARGRLATAQARLATSAERAATLEAICTAAGEGLEVRPCISKN